MVSFFAIDVNIQASQGVMTFKTLYIAGREGEGDNKRCSNLFQSLLQKFSLQGFLRGFHLNPLLLRLTLDPVEVELEVVDALEARLRGHKLVIAVLRIVRGHQG